MASSSIYFLPRVNLLGDPRWDILFFVGPAPPRAVNIPALGILAAQVVSGFLLFAHGRWPLKSIPRILAEKFICSDFTFSCVRGHYIYRRPKSRRAYSFSEVVARAKLAWVIIYGVSCVARFSWGNYSGTRGIHHYPFPSNPAMFAPTRRSKNKNPMAPRFSMTSFMKIFGSRDSIFCPWGDYIYGSPGDRWRRVIG